MKAVVYEKFGNRNVLKVTDFPRPTPKSNEVLVRVRACALNRLDIALREEEDSTIPMPHILGSDIAGDIAEIGSGVRGWKIGEQVIVSPSLSCGRCKACVNNNDSFCEAFQILGYQTQGGYTEYVAVPARNLLRKPKNLTFEEAASLPLVFTTAFHILFTRGRLYAGENALVMGGSSGVGTALIQLCKTSHAQVIATVGDEEKVKRLKELGADKVVNHRKKGWNSKVLELTSGKGVDLVCEHFGGKYLLRCINLLKKGGRIVTIGSITGDELKMNISTLYRRQISLIGSYMGSKKELEEVLKLIEAKKIHPVVDKIFPLEKAKEAHKYLEERKNFGKVVLKI